MSSDRAVRGRASMPEIESPRRITGRPDLRSAIRPEQLRYGVIVRGTRRASPCPWIAQNTYDPGVRLAVPISRT